MCMSNGSAPASDRKTRSIARKRQLTPLAGIPHKSYFPKVGGETATKISIAWKLFEPQHIHFLEPLREIAIRSRAGLDIGLLSWLEICCRPALPRGVRRQSRSVGRDPQ